MFCLGGAGGGEDCKSQGYGFQIPGVRIPNPRGTDCKSQGYGFQIPGVRIPNPRGTDSKSQGQFGLNFGVGSFYV